MEVEVDRLPPTMPQHPREHSRGRARPLPVAAAARASATARLTPGRCRRALLGPELCSSLHLATPPPPPSSHVLDQKFGSSPHLATPPPPPSSCVLGPELDAEPHAAVPPPPRSSHVRTTTSAPLRWRPTRPTPPPARPPSRARSWAHAAVVPEPRNDCFRVCGSLAGTPEASSERVRSSVPAPHWGRSPIVDMMEAEFGQVSSPLPPPS
mmetsp:Transcript_49498/g.141908  ORF Transcript_49498/g.141908 Transcript_49498/m.141908 type:complete len:210 (-) Transcript_49498:837-1466(-)